MFQNSTESTIMEWYWTLTLVLGSVTLGLAANRLPWLGWVALTPLAVALYWLPPAAAGAGAAAVGAVLVGSAFTSRTMLPVVAVVPPVLLRWAGGPRWAANPLARTQEAYLPVVHMARLGSDLVVTAAMGLTSAVVAVTIVELPPQPVTVSAVAVAVAVVVGALAFGVLSHRAAQRRVLSAPTLRVAAVVCDGPRPDGPLDGLWPLRSPDYVDVAGTLERYRSRVAEAADAGARVVVLPEVGVRVDAGSRQAWVDGVGEWARTLGVTVVAPFYDTSRPRNELVVCGPGGNVVGHYEKQHPAPVEGKRHERMPPGLVGLDEAGGVALSTVICVDLDYNDLVGPVARAGGVLAVPANDWPVFEAMHHRTAVWAAVMAGVSLVRATGQGTSACFDPAGRVICHQSSLSGPVVLVADVPV